MNIDSIMSTVKNLLDKAESMLNGEPARFLGYGAAVVVVGVVAVANALGITKFGANISLTDALGIATAAIGTLVTLIESIRHFVYSPNSVTALTATSTNPVFPVDGSEAQG